MAHKIVKSTLQDYSPIPYGKYKGIPMQDVPAEYLHWHWHNCKGGSEATDLINDYIKRNLDALREENSDLIWS